MLNENSGIPSFRYRFVVYRTHCVCVYVFCIFFLFLLLLLHGTRLSMILISLYSSIAVENVDWKYLKMQYFTFRCCHLRRLRSQLSSVSMYIYWKKPLISLHLQWTMSMRCCVVFAIFSIRSFFLITVNSRNSKSSISCTF